MSDSNPKSRTQNQKQPGGGKAALKTETPLKYFNAHKPLWADNLGWIGWLGETDGPNADPRLGGITTILYEEIQRSAVHDGIHDWGIILNPWGHRLEKARMYAATPYFMHWLLSRIVEWHGYAIYSTVWNRTELDTRGTELSHPHRQRIEDDDSKRFRTADKAAAEAELAWTRRWP